MPNPTLANLPPAVLSCPVFDHVDDAGSRVYKLFALTPYGYGSSSVRAGTTLQYAEITNTAQLDDCTYTFEDAGTIDGAPAFYLKYAPLGLYVAPLDPQLVLGTTPTPFRAERGDNFGGSTFALSIRQDDAWRPIGDAAATLTNMAAVEYTPAGGAPRQVHAETPAAFATTTSAATRARAARDGTTTTHIAPYRLNDAGTAALDGYTTTYASTATTTPAGNQLFYTKFAPLVKLCGTFSSMFISHGPEDNRPSSVDWYLAQCTVWKQLGLLPQISYHEYSTDQLSTLSGGPYANPPDHARHSFYVVGKLGTCPAIYAGESDVTVSGSTPPACYVSPLPLASDPDLWDLQYWFFYPYNGNLANEIDNIASHEGDWEHVTVRVRLSTQAIQWVCYYAHNGDRQYRPAGTTPVPMAEGHPVVYSAFHSHASYPTAGEQERIGPNDFTSDNGTHWHTWNNIVEINYQYPTLNDVPWMRFTGRWGATDGIITVSPFGPGMKENFYDGDVPPA